MATKRSQQPAELDENEPGGIVVEPLDRPTEIEDEPNGNTPPADPPTVRAGERLYTEAEVRAQQEAARKQEKDKLYDKLSEQEKILADLQTDLKQRRDAEEAARKQAEEAQAAKDREELTAKELLDRQNQEWEAKFAALHQDLQQRDAIIAREAQFQELQGLRSRLLQEADAENTIADELLDYVGGSSEEEIRQSIAMAQAKSASIVEQVRKYQQQQRRDQKGVSVTQPPVGPMETDQVYETLTPKDIADMDMATYAKNRTKLLGAASRAARGAQ